MSDSIVESPLEGNIEIYNLNSASRNEAPSEHKEDCATKESEFAILHNSSLIDGSAMDKSLINSKCDGSNQTNSDEQKDHYTSPPSVIAHSSVSANAELNKGLLQDSSNSDNAQIQKIGEVNVVTEEELNFAVEQSLLEQSNAANSHCVPNNPGVKRPLWPESRKGSAKSRSISRSTFKPFDPGNLQYGKYEEIPNLLDGFRILNNAPAHDPDHVFSIDVSSQELMFVVEDDLTQFRNLETLKASENALPLARLGVLPSLKKLVLSCNGVTSLDLDVEGKFEKLESLDLSFNNIDHSAQIVLSTLPSLRFLDLTNNNIKALSKMLTDISNWQENVIELLLPAEVAAIDAHIYDTHSVNISSENDYIPGDIKNKNSSKSDTPTLPKLTKPGFQMLHILNLEGNKLGSSDQGFWDVLGCLPNLKILNLNDNRIFNTRPLIQVYESPISATTIFDINAVDLPKYKGFENLLELHLCKNIISSLDDLIGIIFVQKLEQIYLEGNPVMKQYNSAQMKKTISRRSSKRGILSAPSSFNFFKKLYECFNIRVSDKFYCTSKVHFSENFISIRPLVKGGGIIRPLQNRNAEPEQSLLSFDVSVSQPVDTSAKERQLRRDFKLTDEDIKNIIDSGAIPNIKKLIKLRNERLKEKNILEEDEEENQANSMNGENVISDRIENTNDEWKIQYDPEVKDDTFITGVHITGGQINDVEEDSGSDISWDNNSLSESDESEIEEYALENILPNNIQASVRALRHALKNPVSYWRVLEDSYLKPTISSISKAKYEAAKEQYRQQQISENKISLAEMQQESFFSATNSNLKTPSNSLWTPINGHVDLSKGLITFGREQYAPPGKVTYKSRADYLEDQFHKVELKKGSFMEDVERAAEKKLRATMINRPKKYEQLSKLAAIQRAKISGRYKPSEEFEEMSELMNMVEQKMNTVELNLGKVLKSKKLQRHLPASAKLLNDLKNEYARISAQYITDAEHVVESEPLSTRLEKLGMKESGSSQSI